jgi:DNA excision repair protein ERCC-3
VALAPFAALVKSPEPVHSYRLTPLSIWNARAAGLAAGRMVEALRDHARYPVPSGVEQEIRDLADRVDLAVRGFLKQALVGAGYPAEDLAGYVAGEPLAMALREKALAGPPFRLRDYQRDAAEAFYRVGSERGGSGVIVLPCGAGKTIVGLATMALVKQTTLMLTISLTAVKQSRRELLDKTTLRPEDAAEYTGEQKTTGPVTLTKTADRTDDQTLAGVEGPDTG